MPTEALAYIGLTLATVSSPANIDAISGLSNLALVWRLPAALLLFIAPGFALVRATLGERIKGLEVFVLSLGLSIAIAIVTGLLLDAAGQLKPQVWMIVLGGITVISGALAKLQGRRLLPRIARPMAGIGRAEAAMVCTALVMAAAAVLLARRGAELHNEFSFTQFWLVPTSDGDSTLATLGIANNEGAPTWYDVDILVDGRLIERRADIEVENGGEHVTSLALPLQANQKAEAWLFKNGNHREVYRKVWLWSRPTDARRRAWTGQPASAVSAADGSSPGSYTSGGLGSCWYDLRCPQQGASIVRSTEEGR
jgi:hypothetical protein